MIRHRAPAPPRVGEIVEVRSAEEILATLDGEGELEGLPFMPEMLQFCGRRLEVAARAVKLCDTIDLTGHHRMRDAVHLVDARCDGEAHGGCQASCLLYWKEAWLKPPDGDRSAPAPVTSCRETTEATLLEATRRPGEHEVFRCQATELLRASAGRLAWWDPRVYVRDVRSGNVAAGMMLRSLAVMLFNKVQGFSRRYLPRRLWIHGAERYPFIRGTRDKTPMTRLDLVPGERVRIKTRAEIEQTLDAKLLNRGMSFDCEMLRYCGREAVVRTRVERIIDEKDGRMRHFGNPCIILEGVTCRGDYHQYCPRAIFPYWREIWLERA